MIQKTVLINERSRAGLARDSHNFFQLRFVYAQKDFGRWWRHPMARTGTAPAQENAAVNHHNLFIHTAFVKEEPTS